MRNKLLVGSDYSGVGAFDQALIRNGINYKKAFSCDFDYNARLTYLLNFGTDTDLILAQSKEHKMFCSGMEFIILGKSEEKDIREFEKKCIKLNVTGSDLETKKYNFSIAADNYASTFSFYYPFNVYDRQIPEEPLDIFMTSPPCQAFSLAGKRLGKKDIKGILFFNSLEFIEKNKPETFIFENVKGLLSDDKTNKSALYGNTFQEWINYLGGKSVNGNPTFFPYEDSVPYHIYFKVLNAKEFGIPQNRERIFIIGIRDDEKSNFDFPMPFPLEKRLKDILESIVDEKYFLSDAMVDFLTGHAKKHQEKGNGFNFKTKEPEDTANAINARCFKMGVDDNYVKEENPIILEHRGHIEKEPKLIYNGVVPCLRAESHGHETKVIINESILLNRNKYNDYSESEISSTITAGGTAGGSNLPLVVIQKTRGDCYTIKSDGTTGTLQAGGHSVSDKVPCVIINSNTKKGYDIAKEKEDSINLSIPTSKTRRGRIGKGLSQTLDTSCNQGIYTQQKIRRLTPTECFRLMDFSPEMIEKTISSGLISDSQLYKQAGNSICVGVLTLLIRKII